MKMLMLIGAILGFVLGIALGVAARAEWPAMLWHACASAAMVGLLMRWWGRIWVRGLYDSLAQRRAPQTVSPTPRKK
jgi:galactitol-specific phosphotransferase system IIC component